MKLLSSPFNLQVYEGTTNSSSPYCRTSSQPARRRRLRLHRTPELVPSHRRIARISCYSPQWQKIHHQYPHQHIDYDGRKFYIVSVKGTAYEMGLAYGTLMKEELKVMEKEFFGWASNFIANNVTQISMLPKWLRHDIG